MVSRRVLVIDDEVDSCHLLKAFLTQLGFEVHTAFTLRDGLTSVQNLSPAIIFLDNNLPDGLGWEQVSLIRQFCPHCKINLISAFDYHLLPQTLAGVSVIEKPISLSTLKQCL